MGNLRRHTAVLLGHLQRDSRHCHLASLARPPKTKLPPCRLVIFDKDGTLLDDAATWSPLIKQLSVQMQQHAQPSELYDALGYDPIRGSFTRESCFMTATNAEVVEILWAKLGASAAGAYGNWIATLDPSSAAGVPVVPLRPVFEDLHAIGARIALLTSDNRRFAEAFLAKQGVLDIVEFGASVCGDDGLNPKPSPEPAVTICSRLGVTLEEAVMVGDSAERDICCAISARLGSAVGVLSGISPAEVLEHAGAHAVVPTVAQVLDVIHRRHLTL